VRIWTEVLWGRVRDSDFLGFNLEHAAGYVRVDVGGTRCIPVFTAYVSVVNALRRRYNEVVRYPALSINFRAGLRASARGRVSGITGPNRSILPANQR
jgi:hypothetical protein